MSEMREGEGRIRVEVSEVEGDGKVDEEGWEGK